jgi:hypothetical protein
MPPRPAAGAVALPVAVLTFELLCFGRLAKGRTLAAGYQAGLPLGRDRGHSDKRYTGNFCLAHAFRLSASTPARLERIRAVGGPTSSSARGRAPMR